MRSESYPEKREQWRAMIRQNDDRSEIVNYDDTSFPSYAFKGHMDGSSPWIRKVHWHEDVEFMAVLTGEMAYSVNGTTVKVRAGDTIFINSRNLHYSMDVSNIYCTYIIMVIHPRILISSPEVESEYVLPLISNAEIPYMLFGADSPDSGRIAELAQSILDSRGNQFEITRFFFELWHYVLLGAKKVSPLVPERKEHHIESLKNMIGYIRDNYNNPLSLESIARYGNMSKSSCNTLFKKYTGHTPIEYLIRCRLDKAIELLTGTNDTISSISVRCGFSTSSYMTELFVRHYHMTPREFRKRQRE